MYKTIKLDLQAKFELNDPYWAEVVPTAWLSKTNNQVLANLYNNSRIAKMTADERKLLEDEDPEAMSRAISGLDQDFEFIAKALCVIVIDWNLMDEDDRKVDIPKKLDADGRLVEVLANIPSAILTYIFEAASSDDYAAIPLVKSRELVLPSPAPTPIRMAQEVVPEVELVPLPLN